MYTIYKIENLVNNKVYYGQTRRDIKKRISAHTCLLNTDKHPNAHLQNAWKYHGKENFKFTIVYQTTDEALLDTLERLYILFRNTTDVRFGYNKTSGGVAHRTFTQESIEKIRNTKLKIYRDPAYVNPLQGRKLTMEAIENNRLAQLKHASSPEYKNPSKGKPSAKRIPIIDSTGFLWDSISLAAKFFKLNPCIIVQAIQNRRPLKCNGLFFHKLT